ncbi:hypothetical protein [Bacillus sp. PM43]|uniref:hypothetical protein n=1 Tax=Bacillus sp. PM43 TaxID=3414494 RepID=UPI003DA89EBE
MGAILKVVFRDIILMIVLPYVLIVTNAIKIGHCSAHNLSMKKERFYAVLVICVSLLNFMIARYMVFGNIPEKLEDLFRQLPIMIIFCLTLTVIHAVISRFAENHFKTKLAD